MLCYRKLKYSNNMFKSLVYFPIIIIHYYNSLLLLLIKCINVSVLIFMFSLIKVKLSYCKINLF